MANKNDTVTKWKTHENGWRVRRWLNSHKKFLSLTKSMAGFVDDDIIGLQEAAVEDNKNQNKNDQNDNSKVEKKENMNNEIILDSATTQRLLIVNEQFSSLIRMLRSHSKFEENRLFPFLRQEFPNTFGEKTYNNLINDHNQHCILQGDEILNILNQLLKVENENDNTNENINTNEEKKNIQDSNKTSNELIVELKDILFDFDKYLREHLIFEEKSCVDLWLSMNKDQYEKYKVFSLKDDSGANICGGGGKSRFDNKKKLNKDKNKNKNEKEKEKEDDDESDSDDGIGTIDDAKEDDS